MTTSDAASDPFGVLLVDKPRACTSHDVVQWARRTLGCRRVGHCGTLDPAATGLLVVCVGKATRLSRYLTAATKNYDATVVLGEARDTWDADGEPTASAPVSEAVQAGVAGTLESMRGSLWLKPPTASALWVDGRRAHARARAGESVQLAAREMTVFDVRFHGLTRSESTVAVHVTWCVSKGTYVRSLAVELGRRLGVPAHLGALRRVASGSSRVDQPQVVGGLEACRVPDRRGILRTRLQWQPAVRAEGVNLRAHLRQWLLNPVAMLPFPSICVDPASTRELDAFHRLVQGQPVEDHVFGRAVAEPKSAPCVALWIEGPPARIVVAQASGGRLAPQCVIADQRAQAAVNQHAPKDPAAIGALDKPATDRDAAPNKEEARTTKNVREARPPRTNHAPVN